ncbi:hypothetical protein BVL54_20105 [Bacillus paralicheniformis]|nr:hypothetical protein BVL54_20105 [Bacillus paralicheniformis]
MNVDIVNDLKGYQTTVGGYIEVAYINEERTIAAIFNEEGKILNLPPNIDIGFDKIVGTVVIVGADGEEFRSLTEEERKIALDWLDEHMIK